VASRYPYPSLVTTFLFRPETNMTRTLKAGLILTTAVVLLAVCLTDGTGEWSMNTSLQASVILLVASYIVAMVSTRTNPLTLAARGAVMSRALWLFAREIVQGAWGRRGRWRECVLRARSEV